MTAVNKNVFLNQNFVGLFHYAGNDVYDAMSEVVYSSINHVLTDTKVYKEDSLLNLVLR